MYIYYAVVVVIGSYLGVHLNIQLTRIDTTLMIIIQSVRFHICRMGIRLLDIHGLTIKLVLRTWLIFTTLNLRSVNLVMVVNSNRTRLVLGGAHHINTTLDFMIVVDVGNDYVWVVAVFDSDVLFACVIFVVYVDAWLVECVMCKLLQTLFLNAKTIDPLVICKLSIFTLLRESLFIQFF